jgi:signal transduction histidine kinase
MLLQKNPQNMLLWAKISFIGTSFTAVLLLRFIFAYSKTLINKKFFILFYLAAAGAAVLNFYTGYFLSPLHFIGYSNNAGILHMLIPAQLIIFIFIALKNLKENLRKPDLTAFRHQQILKIRSALFLFFLVAADQILSFFLIPSYPIASLSAVGFIAAVALALGRYTFADVKIAVSRIFIILVIISSVIGSSYLVWKYSNLWAVSSAFTFILAVAGAYVYKAASGKTEELFLSEQKKSHNILIQAASGMAREHELNKLLKLLSIIVMRSLRVKNIAVYIGNESGKLFECMHIRPYADDEMLFPYSAANPFVNFMKNKAKPFVTADIPLYITNSANLPFKSSMIIPFFFESGANGFIILGQKKDKTSFNREDIKVFQTLARQTALAIENCMFFEEFKHTQEKIFAAEKLASVGGLADGVAHQINNRLNQFSMICAELKFEIEDFKKENNELICASQNLKKTFEYIVSLSDSLEENIKRTDSVIKGILNYARSDKNGGAPAEFAIKEAFDLAMELLKLKHKLHKDFKLELKFKDTDKIYGLRSQIIECVYNVLDNAYEATIEKIDSLSAEEKKNYVPSIKASLKYGDEKAALSISDNGMGIKEENKIKIFAPFFTTKSSYKSGTGIGLYIVKRMIEENHGGRLTFESKYGQGTKIIFELPLKKQ